MMHEVKVARHFSKEVRDDGAKRHAGFLNNRSIWLRAAQHGIAPAGEKRSERGIRLLRGRLGINAGGLDQLREIPSALVGELRTEFLAGCEQRELAQHARDPCATFS